MNNMFTIFEKEMDVDNAEINLLIGQMNHSYYMMEAKTNQKKNIIQSILDKLKEIIDKIKSKIQEIFASKQLKETEKQVEEILKNNPSIKNQKIEVKDYTKLEELNEKTAKELMKSKDPASVIEKYKKQRNLLIGAVGVVSLGSFLIYRKKNKYEDMSDRYWDMYMNVQGEYKNTYDELQDVKFNLASSQTRINRLNSQNEQLKDKNHELQEKISSVSEFIKISNGDVLNSLGEYVSVLKNIATSYVKVKDSEMDAVKDMRKNGEYEKASKTYKNINKTNAQIRDMFRLWY